MPQVTTGAIADATPSDKLHRRCFIRTCAALTLSLDFASYAQSQPTRIRIGGSDANAPMSYSENGALKGMMRDVIEALFAQMPEFEADFYPLPWARAQMYVQHGTMEMFCTFPSESRRAYAEFTVAPLIVANYGYLVFHRDNPKRQQLENANSFEDLRGLIFVSEKSVAWEKENVPSYIERYMVAQPDALLHMTLHRKVGDFFIMGIEQAIHNATRLGYEKLIGIKNAEFIPNSKVPFHIGVSKKFVGKDALLAATAKAMRSPEFKARAKVIDKQYKTFFQTAN